MKSTKILLASNREVSGMKIEIHGEAKEIAALVLALQERQWKPIWCREKAPEKTHILTVDEMPGQDFSFLRPEDLPRVLATEPDTPTAENH